MFLLLNVKYDLEMFSGRLIFTVLFEIDTTLTCLRYVDMILQEVQYHFRNQIRCIML